MRMGESEVRHFRIGKRCRSPIQNANDRRLGNRCDNRALNNVTIDKEDPAVNSRALSRMFESHR